MKRLTCTAVLSITLTVSILTAQKTYDATVKEKEILTPAANNSPQINVHEVYGARPGKPFIYRIPTTGTRPMQFEAKNLPSSLNLDKETGIITGRTPLEEGAYTITFVATNKKGTHEKEFSLVVGDKLALTPPMGWNHWQTYYHLITDEIIRKTTDAMVENGMADCGYQFVTVDDCWMRIKEEYAKEATDPSRKTASVGLDIEAKVGEVRDENGKILTARDFPDMSAMTDHIHSYGLRAGIYSSPGERTCQRFEGSYGHEILDAQTYAEWGFDLLKYDWCSYNNIFKVMKGDEIVNGQIPYKLMGGALEMQDRDIVGSACQYGWHDVWKWGPEAGWQYWRIGGDLAHTATEGGIYKIAKKTIDLREYNGPGSWNDPDFLLIGNWVSPFDKASEPSPLGITTNESYSFFSLWCMMACPLIASVDLINMDEFALSIYTNTEMIAVNQDKLGQCAEPVVMDDEKWILKKTLANGNIVVGFFDVSDKEQEISVSWKDLGIDEEKTARDLWRQKDIGKYDEEIKVKVGPMGCAVIMISK